MADEFRGCLDMTQFVLSTLGLNDYRDAPGLPGSGEREVCGTAGGLGQRAEAALEQVCRELKLPDLDD